MTRPKAVDLFCGCGGISCGLERAGFDIVAGVDIEAVFLKSYALNFPKAKAIQCDLSEIEPLDVIERIGLRKGAIDIIAGGPPCQGFSKNVPRRNRYIEDPKNRLVVAFLKVTELLMPRFVLMENVAEMQNGFEQAYTNLIVELLEERGYTVKFGVLYAPNYGVPQKRRRAFFLASRDNEAIDFPPTTHFDIGGAPSLFDNNAFVNVWDAIGDLPELQHGEGVDPMQYRTATFHQFQEWARGESEQIYNHVARALQPKQYQRLSSIEPGQGLKDLPEALDPSRGTAALMDD